MGLPPQRIVCATDFSPASDAAVRRAAAVAAQHGAQLALLHVVPASLWEGVTERLAELAGAAAAGPELACEQARARLQRDAAGIQAEHALSCAIDVRYGRPAMQIASAARESGADLLAVGAHGAHRVRDLVMGTTAQKLLRIAPCPVLIVRRPPPLPYRSVLLPTDFSAPAALAAEAARTLLPDAVLHFVHAFELPYDGLMRYAGVDAGVADEYRRAAERALRQRMTQLVDAFGAAPARVFAHVRHGYAPARIDEWIVELAVDLVAIAARGKSELEAAFLGSVSAHVVQTARCDVLLVRNGDSTTARG